MLQAANTERTPTSVVDVEHVPPPPARVMSHPIFDAEDEEEPRRSPLRRVVILSVCIAAGVGAAFGWRSYNVQLMTLYQQAKAQIEAKVASSAVAVPAAPPRAAAVPPASAPKAVVGATAAAADSPASAAVSSAADTSLNARLDRLADEIAGIKTSVGQLAGAQQQMKGEITRLQSAQAALQDAATVQPKTPSHWLTDASAFATVRSISPVLASPTPRRPLTRAAGR